MLELEPNNAVAYINKGNALEELGKYDLALEAYDKAIELNPNDYVAQKK
ncbi:MAG TPA: tetratricopeptide repeat protein [Rickettsia endosymbiont of Degeeriella rufa]|nr:tetratricopeptide repeat protein [Rickettsia endosymbiont of Degeeriella rufa]